jgi:hypothetical protein
VEEQIIAASKKRSNPDFLFYPVICSRSFHIKSKGEPSASIEQLLK